MDKLWTILQQHHLLFITGYIEDDICRFVKCISKKTGDACILEMPDPIPAGDITGHRIALKRLDNVPIVDTSTELAAIHQEEDAYDAIYLSDGAPFKDIFEQIKRIGHCFRKISARPWIERDNIICQMKKDFSLRWYQIGSRTPSNWEIVIPLESADISVGTIQARLTDILSEARREAAAKIGSFRPQECVVAAGRAAAQIGAEERELDKMKQTLESLFGREESLQEKRAGFKNLVRRTAQDDLQMADLSRQLEETRRLMLSVIQKIEKARLNVKALYLENEKKFYSLSTALKPFMT